MANIREKHTARITKNADPQKRGRIRVTCPGLMGDTKTELPDWIEPSFDWGWFFVPDIGELVEIECNVTNDHEEDAAYQAFLENPDIRWSGTRFDSLQGGNPRPPDDLLTATHYGKRRGFCTPNGHVLMFDDTTDEQQISLAWRQGDGFANITIDKNGSIIMLDRKGNLICTDATDGQESIVLVGGGNALADPPETGNTIAMDATGIKLVDKFSNIIEMKDGAIQILAAKNIIVSTGENVGITVGGNADLQVIGDVTLGCANAEVTATGDADLIVGGNADLNVVGNVAVQAADVAVTSSGSVNVTAPEVIVDSPAVLLGTGADSALTRFVELKQQFDTHMHPTAGLGAPSPPVVPLLPTAATSTIQGK